MAYEARVLVIASVTAGSDELLQAVEERAGRGPVRITLLMPASQPGLRGREALKPELESTLARWRERGLEVDGSVGDTNPVEAVQEIWSPGAFDEIIVSTLPGSSSKWLQFDFPHRVARITDVPVTHVIAHPRGHDEPTSHPPKREKSSLGPLSVLSWGGRKDD